MAPLERISETRSPLNTLTAPLRGSYSISQLSRSAAMYCTSFPRAPICAALGSQR